LLKRNLDITRITNIIKVYNNVLNNTICVKSSFLREKPLNAESAVWGRFPDSVGESPHLSGARGVSRALMFK